jgi:hypothetical protein
MAKEFKSANDITFAVDESYRLADFKLAWTKRGAHYIEDMLVDTLIREAGSGTITKFAAVSMFELYTGSGLARIEEDYFNATDESAKKAMNQLTEQVTEALCTSGDYAMIRSVFHSLLVNRYITEETPKEEKLIDDGRFETALRYYALLRVIRYVYTANSKVISRAIEDGNKGNTNKK